MGEENESLIFPNCSSKAKECLEQSRRCQEAFKCFFVRKVYMRFSNLGWVNSLL